jgi:hypothetical protein
MGTDVELLDYARETPPPNQSPNLWALVRNGIGEKSKPSALFIFTHEEGQFILREDLKWEAPEFIETFR